ncbi:glycoside hydrolase family 1 protein [Litorihabitans aurantiacus]|uniref:beta-glucosidase n=1 Tax=Litorihabitans aurantiacus TaxID=1930061 RepID=A0AA37XEZ0_9MICO|nr:family 1 glycosylhydrolase [Litorihabitans aurantiacus]GMA31939.1 beta-glucosidase [Litorihabitans aurantiacus]
MTTTPGAEQRHTATPARLASPWPAPRTDVERTFPPTFAWGTATAAYQIEGAHHTGGRTDSIWDHFSRIPGRVVNGDTGEIACDHYHRYPADVALMRDLGVGTYRFSTSWARVRPDGGAVSAAGLDFYDRLVDELLGAGIAPWLTLYHWDLPQALEERGGWRNRDTASLFAEYALDVHAALGDRVHSWTTLNEPWCSAFLGHAAGEHAPGMRQDAEALRAMHHLLLAHGHGVAALRAADPSLELGITLNFSRFAPLDPAREADRDMARRFWDGMAGCFAGPIFAGAYPEGFLADVADIWPADLVRDGDLELISAPIDVLGVNYYNSSVVAAPGGDLPDGAVSDGMVHAGPPGPPDAPGAEGPLPWIAARDAIWIETDVVSTEMGWENHPGAFRDLLVEIDRDLTGPAGTHLVITENGAAYPDDRVGSDGEIDDADRITYLREHIAAVHEAIEAGADVRGYLQWTLLDNFEWAHGYGKRFGVVHVDRETLARTPKASARWYSRVMSTGTLEAVPGTRPTDGRDA